MRKCEVQISVATSSFPLILGLHPENCVEAAQRVIIILNVNYRGSRLRVVLIANHIIVMWLNSKVVNN